MIYGTKKDKLFIASHYDNIAIDYVNKWLDNDQKSQEFYFLKVLSVLLRDGLNAAEAISTFSGLFYDKSSSSSKDDNVNSNGNDDNDGSSSDSLYGYNNNIAFTKDVVQGATTMFKNEVLGVIIPSLLTTSITNDNDNDANNGDIVLTTDSTATTSTTISTTIPSSLSSSSTNEVVVDGMNLDVMQPMYRLYDTYQNAFYRVIEMFIVETTNIKSTTSYADVSNTQRDELIINFLGWEQGLRRNLTIDLWKKNPMELAGTWELIDIGDM
jgi:hypothetical protein